ncbi:MAG: AMP-dependent synthetase and ligase [Frankiales bacterium]|nr:AMP-dependent synthetase and ligase [Frankiales bacterium]
MSKTANLLTDGYGAPDRCGLLLPLHWQTVCFLLGGVAAGATVVVAATAQELAGCSIAFVAAEHAEAALDAGVDDVLACSLTPFGTRLPSVPPLVLDAAAEIPTYGDHFAGRPAGVHLEVGGRSFTVPAADLNLTDRVLTRLEPSTPDGLAALLGPLRAGAAVVLLVEGDQEAVIAQEQVTAVVDAGGLRRLP